MIFAETCQGGKLVDGKVFRTVIIDILADMQKFINILMLFLLDQIFILPVQINAVPAYNYKKRCQQGIYGGFIKRRTVDILLCDLVHDVHQLLLVAGTVLRFDTDTGIKAAADGINTV